MALMVFDVLTLIIDVWDPAGFNQFTSIRSAIAIRNSLEVNYRQLALHTLKLTAWVEDDDDGPLLYPVALVWPEAALLADHHYTARVIDEVCDPASPYHSASEEAYRALDEYIDKNAQYFYPPSPCSKPTVVSFGAHWQHRQRPMPSIQHATTGHGASMKTQCGFIVTSITTTACTRRVSTINALSKIRVRSDGKNTGVRVMGTAKQ